MIIFFDKYYQKLILTWLDNKFREKFIQNSKQNGLSILFQGSEILWKISKRITEIHHWNINYEI